MKKKTITTLLCEDLARRTHNAQTESREMNSWMLGRVAEYLVWEHVGGEICNEIHDIFSADGKRVEVKAACTVQNKGCSIAVYNLMAKEGHVDEFFLINISNYPEIKAYCVPHDDLYDETKFTISKRHSGVGLGKRDSSYLMWDPRPDGLRNQLNTSSLKKYEVMLTNKYG